MKRGAKKTDGGGLSPTVSSPNPKDVSAREKVPMWALPAIGAVHGAMACGDGVAKGHGAYNWRERPISMMEHIGAIERHIACLKDGENNVSDGRASHLGCINATAAIILDAQACGTLIDDRPVAHLGSTKQLEEYRDVTAATRPQGAGGSGSGIRES